MEWRATKEWDEDQKNKKKETKSGPTTREPIKQGPSTLESVELVVHSVEPTSPE